MNKQGLTSAGVSIRPQLDAAFARERVAMLRESLKQGAALAKAFTMERARSIRSARPQPLHPTALPGLEDVLGGNESGGTGASVASMPASLALISPAKNSPIKAPRLNAALSPPRTRIVSRHELERIVVAAEQEVATAPQSPMPLKSLSPAVFRPATAPPPHDSASAATPPPPSTRRSDKLRSPGASSTSPLSSPKPSRSTPCPPVRSTRAADLLQESTANKCLKSAQQPCFTSTRAELASRQRTSRIEYVAPSRAAMYRGGVARPQSSSLYPRQFGRLRAASCTPPARQSTAPVMVTYPRDCESAAPTDSPDRTESPMRHSQASSLGSSPLSQDEDAFFAENAASDGENPFLLTPQDFGSPHGDGGGI